VERYRPVIARPPHAQIAMVVPVETDAVKKTTRMKMVLLIHQDRHGVERKSTDLRRR
jgi:hypothetical protein